MSPRKPTIDDLDDIDDEDGALQEENAEPGDLDDLTVVDAEDITGASPPEFDEQEDEEE